VRKTQSGLPFVFTCTAIGRNTYNCHNSFQMDDDFQVNGLPAMNQAKSGSITQSDRTNILGASFNRSWLALAKLLFI
jgi:hypothetical protein